MCVGSVSLSGRELLYLHIHSQGAQAGSGVREFPAESLRPCKRITGPSHSRHCRRWNGAMKVVIGSGRMNGILRDCGGDSGMG